MDDDNKTSKYVHIARPIEPQHQEISETAQLRHTRSVEAFPELNLSRGEHVILCIMRHKISLVKSLGVCIAVLAVSFILIMNMDITLKIMEIMGLPRGTNKRDIFYFRMDDDTNFSNSLYSLLYL